MNLPSLNLIENQVLVEINNTNSNSSNIQNKQLMAPNKNKVEAKLLHDNSRFSHSKTSEINSKIISKTVEPSMKLLYGQVETVTENTDYKKNKTIQPSLVDLHRQFYGNSTFRNKKVKIQKQKHNLSHPSLNYLENQVKNGKINSLNDDNKNKTKHFEPSMDLDGKILNINLNVNYDTQNNINKKINGTMLPGYVGLRGVMINDDENFKHDHKSFHNQSNNSPADLNDFNKWQEEQDKISRLSRFRALQLELQKQNQKIDYRDEQVISSTIIDEKTAKNNLLSPEQKLAIAIKEMEEEENRKKQKRKFDL